MYIQRDTRHGEIFSNTGASRQQTRIQNVLLRWKFIRFWYTFFVLFFCRQLVRQMGFPLYMGPMNTSHKFLRRPTCNATGGACVKMLSRQRMYRPKYCKVTDLNFISLSNDVAPPCFRHEIQK
jgi:hypothetical protein